MKKKDKKSPLRDYEKLKNEIARDKVDEIFRDHPKAWITKLEDFGFTFFDDEDDSEALEEQNAKPENQRHKDLVDFFENSKKLSLKIFELFSEEKASNNPNYPLIRKYFRQANPNLKALILYGLDNYPARIDLLDDLAFFNEFENVLGLLIAYYTRACVKQANLETFTKLAQDFYYATSPDDYEAYSALQGLFEFGTNKRTIIDSLIEAEKDDENINLSF